MTVNYLTTPGGNLNGEICVPGDKSISHRAVILGALANGDTEISNFLEGEDALATIKAMRSLGINIEGPDRGKVKIVGQGLKGLQPSKLPLNMGNSGTSMRLLSGVLVAQNFDSFLYGDDSLMSRPMRRVIDPLRAMGGSISGGEKGCPPLSIRGNQNLKPINYEMPIASAQVKSCLLLAALYTYGSTIIREPSITRDHTERMLTGFGYPILRSKDKISLSGGGKLLGTKIEIPGDLSSAAFFIVGACITPGSDILLTNVGINPTRAGVLRILELMGASLEILNAREISGEPVGDIRVRYSQLFGIEIPKDLVPLAIDEFPVIFIAAACAVGDTQLSGAAELRVKESDRIASMAMGLDTLGVKTEVSEDGIVIFGGNIKGGKVNSFGDHRVAMAFSIAGLIASNPIQILNCNNVATSFPNFINVAENAGMSIRSKF